MAEAKLLLVLVVAIVTRTHGYDLSGIRVSGNRFVNHANQQVTLMVSIACMYIHILNYVRHYIHESLKLRYKQNEDSFLLYIYTSNARYTLHLALGLLYILLAYVHASQLYRQAHL